MTIEFSDGISGNRRGEVQLFIEQKVDRDTDVYLCAKSGTPGNYDYMRVYWHKSDADSNRHLTGDVFRNSEQVGTAHIYENGQVTMFSSGAD